MKCYWIAVGLAVGACFTGAGQESLSLEVIVGTAGPAPLVRFDDPWLYRKGTNAPAPNWQTQETELLDDSWSTGTGGFGYAPDNVYETSRCGTILGDMHNVYSTVYVRRTFEVTEAVEPTQRLLLTVDWDDGFVAYLDGVEVQRYNAPGQIGLEPSYGSTATLPHESSRGNPESTPEPAKAFDLGAVGSRLGVGRHVLALMGLNRAIDSSDFVLVADLSLSEREARASGEGHFALVSTNLVTLGGTNGVAGSTRVVVNGTEAEFDMATRRWRSGWRLGPGMNRLFVAALDAGGKVLCSTNRDIIAELSTLYAGGMILTNSTWIASGGVVRVTSGITVGPGATLTIGEGSVVLMPSGGRMEVGANGTLSAVGAADAPVFLLPEDGTRPWGEVSVVGANSSVVLRQVEMVAGGVRAGNGGSVLVEDSILRDLTNGAPIAAGQEAAGLTLRRTQVARYGSIRSRSTLFLAEGCLFEEMSEAGLDVGGDGSAQVRRCTLRQGSAGLVLTNSAAPLVEGCLVHGFDATGVSIGGQAHRSVVSNSLIYWCGSGIAVRGATNLILAQNTVTGCEAGLDAGRGLGVVPAGFITNVIIWGNTTNLVGSGSSAVIFSHSDVEGGVAGAANIAMDPLFVEPQQGDFRLQDSSPARGTGFGGGDMGVLFPIGGVPSAPQNATVLTDGTNVLQVTWEDTSENESGFAIERSGDGIGWWHLGETGPNGTSIADAGALAGQRYFYRVRAMNTAGYSPWSNLAGGRRERAITRVGGVLAVDQVWSEAMGTILVTSNVVVPANRKLTLLAGTTVAVTNGMSIVAQPGGAILLAGEADNRVRIGPAAPNGLWRELSVQGAGASIIARYADISAGQTTVYSNAAGLFEDCYFHDYRNPGGNTFSSPIVLSSFASNMTLRRCHLREYYEALFRDGVILIEGTLFEYMSGDALDFDGAQPGTILRNSTFRHGTRATSNIDAVDIGPGQLGASRSVLVENCLIYDFPTDKGISIGDAPTPATGTAVRNCLIYDCLSGMQVKDSSFAEVYHCTIVGNRWGFTNYNKVNPSAPTGGGHITNAHNNILWNNQVTISMWNGSTLTADHNDFGNTDWPGVGNIKAAPQFVNEAGRDYRLGPDSPCRGVGRDGANLGAAFPVGAPMAASHVVFEQVQVSDGKVVIRFRADPEKKYQVMASASVDGPWTVIADVETVVLPELIEVHDLMGGTKRFYRLAAEAR